MSKKKNKSKKTNKNTLKETDLNKENKDKTEQRVYTIKKKISNHEEVSLKEVPIIEFESLSGNLKPSKIKKNDNDIKKVRENEEEKEVKKETLKENKNAVKEENSQEEKNIKEDSKQTNNLNDQIQSFISILFTIIIFIALILLIIILYNNYFKKEEEINLDEVCVDYIEKDYGITNEMITNFIRNSRAIIYNYDNFDKNKITNDDLIKFATYFIWSQDLEYEVCDDSDDRCLVSKMEMDLDTLKVNFKNYLNITDLKIVYNTDYQDNDTTRLYQDGDKVVLTFSEFLYQTLRHNIIDTNIKEDKVTITFALEKLVDNTNIYSYAGYKKVELKYHDKNFSIEKIETSLKK